FFQAEDGIRDATVTGVQTCALPILVVIGIILFLVAATTLTAPSSNPFDFAATQARMSSAFGTAVVGMILLGVGGVALRLGLIRPVTSYVASEASPAIERVSEAAGEGLRQGCGGDPLQSGSVIKVKCRNCGYLENEE